MGSRPPTIQEVADLDKRINRSDILSEFKYARRYLEKIVLLVDHSEREEATSIKEKATEQGLTADEYFLMQDENTYTHQQIFPRILRSSLIMHLCSMIDVKLLMIAEKLHVHQRAPKRLGEYLAANPSKDLMKDRIAKYILNAIGVKINTSQRWVIICDIFQLRNIFAHAGGVVNTARASKTAIKNIASIASKYQAHGTISADYGPYLSPRWIVIEVSSEICRFFIDETEAYFDEILSKIGAPF